MNPPLTASHKARDPFKHSKPTGTSISTIQRRTVDQMLLCKLILALVVALALASPSPSPSPASLFTESKIAQISQNVSITPATSNASRFLHRRGDDREVKITCKPEWPSESKEKAPWEDSWEDRICPDDVFPDVNCLPPEAVPGPRWPTKSTQQNCCYYNYACFKWSTTEGTGRMKTGSEKWKIRDCCWQTMNENPFCINPPGPPDEETDMEFLPPPFCIN